MKKQKSFISKMLDLEKQQVIISDAQATDLKGGRSAVQDPDG